MITYTFTLSANDPIFNPPPLHEGMVIDEEHGTKIGDPDLVACLQAEFGAEWDSFTPYERMEAQWAWVQPMPMRRNG